MDFASLMSAQMAKKKKQLGGANDRAGQAIPDAPPTKKFVRNSEIEAERKAAYLKEQEAKEAEKAAKAAVKRQREEEAAEKERQREEKRRRLAMESRKQREIRQAEEDAARRKRLGLPERPPPNSDKHDGKAGSAGDADDDDDDNKDLGADLDEDDLRAALRKLDAPIILFGENHAQRLQRYRQTAAAAAAALTTAEAAKLPVPTTLVPVPEKDMKVPAVADIPRDKKGRRYLYRQLASYFNLVLREWQQALQEASTKNDGETEASRGARNIMEQSRASIKPVCFPLPDSLAFARFW